VCAHRGCRYYAMADFQTDIDAVLAEAEALATEATGTDTSVVDQPPDRQDTDTTHHTAYDTATNAAYRPDAQQQPQGPLDRVLKLKVPVIVRLAERKMRLSEILAVSAGAIIEFEKPFDAALDLLVNNKQVGQGQAVKAGENFGLRILTIGSLRDKVDALAES